MRVYVSNETGKKLEGMAEKKADSPENILQEAVDRLEQSEGEPAAREPIASEVPKSG